MKEWEKHLGRAEEKLRSANILFENNMFADAIYKRRILCDVSCR